MHRCITLLTTLLCCATLLTAQQMGDSALQKLYQRYFQLYDEPDKEKEFFDASQLIKSHYLNEGNRIQYYNICLNEVLYDTENGKTYRAVKRSNDMLSEMNQHGDKYYNIVYIGLGTIYESRGNYRMANYYYNEAMKYVDKNDDRAMLSILPRIASLKAPREPHEAWELNERFGKLTDNSPAYRKVYLALKGKIQFFLGRKDDFLLTDREFQEFLQQHRDLDNYGISTMAIIRHAYNGEYDEAIKLLHQENPDWQNIDMLDIEGKVVEMKGDYQEALRISFRRRDLRDSLNSDLIFNNLNELNAEMGLVRLTEKASQERDMLTEKAAREREHWLAAVIILLLAALGLIVWRHLTRRRYQKQLVKQNRELEIALDHAKESDRMKSAFIEHVSHEIRTPLNVITGFAQIVTNPDYQLEEDERNVMLNDISHNTVKITDIVNELLEVAQDESKEHYEKNDNVNVNELCQNILKESEQLNGGRLELRFRSTLNQAFLLHTNRKVLAKILQQLVANAIKFTEHGTVELKVRERAANGGIEFSVTDTGIGIDEQYHDKVFERFFKVDTFKQGLGLGLTMSRKMAELIGGTLTIDKGYKKGTRFLLVLPQEPIA